MKALQPYVLGLFVVVAFLAVFSFVQTSRDAEARRLCTPYCALAPNYAARDRLAPDFELPDLTGRKVKLSSFRGELVVMHFWTKNCAPCLKELPSFAQFARSLQQRVPNSVVLAVNTDETMGIARDTLRSVLGDDEAPFLVLHDPDSAVVADKYGTKLYPETWFIDGKGVIRARVDGARSWSGATGLTFAEGLMSPLSCRIQFRRGEPAGPMAGLCGG